MGLGPPVCKTCMRLMGVNPTDSGRYWGCETCGTDDMQENCTHLFGQSEENLDIILKDDPELRQIMRELRELNKR